jgi:hypothetical protein
MPQITKTQLAAAFKAWNKDYRKNPDDYVSEHTFQTDPIGTVSSTQADILLGYVREVKTKGPPAPTPPPGA